ncbi:MAG TPA: hypothetical protein VNH11_19925 [Pirellulales bacterium]|nr:hypothetical protein [Pirellulales bacterium]
MWLALFLGTGTLCAADGPSKTAQMRFASAPMAGQGESEGDASPDDSVDDRETYSPVLRPIEAYLDAAPPPDPPPPQWGSLEQPIRAPLEMPTYNYLQAAPPKFVIQPNSPPIYRRPVEDPDRLSYDDDLLNMPVNLYRPDGIAPPGVTGDHTLKTGHALFSYRYSVVGFQASQTGAHVDTAAEVLNRFTYAPQRMYQQQHLFLLEYAPTDDLTLMAQLPVQENSIDYVARNGSTVHDAYTQLGDVKLWALYALKRWKNQQIHANLGLSVPTNLIQSIDQFSLPGSLHLSYPIRIGSGSYDLMPGLTYRGQTERWTWGLQSIATIRTGMNRYGYELGNQIDLNAWAWRRLTDRFAASGRLHGMGWGNIRGMDPNLTQTLVETNVPGLQGGTRVDLLFGGQYYLPWVRVPGNWFSIEAGVPIYQNLHGPQPRATWLLNGGWNMMW